MLLKNVMLKISKLREMCQFSRNLLSLTDFEEYARTDSFQKFIIVINEYYTKYQGIFQDKWKTVFAPVASEIA